VHERPLDPFLPPFRDVDLLEGEGGEPGMVVDMLIGVGVKSWTCSV
jgi:hypothetical protein